MHVCSPSVYATAVLQFVSGHRCAAVHGLNLWGPSSQFEIYTYVIRTDGIVSDWLLLEGHINLRDACNLLGGNLSRNVQETQQLISTVRNTDPNRSAQNYVQMIEEMFELENYPPGDWPKDEWYCLGCMRDLFKERLRKWWLAKKQRGRLIRVHCCRFAHPYPLQMA